jgi:hypothetical protein
MANLRQQTQNTEWREEEGKARERREGKGRPRNGL